MRIAQAAALALVALLSITGIPSLRGALAFAAEGEQATASADWQSPATVDPLPLAAADDGTSEDDAADDGVAMSKAGAVDEDKVSDENGGEKVASSAKAEKEDAEEEQEDDEPTARKKSAKKDSEENASDEKGAAGKDSAKKDAEKKESETKDAGTKDSDQKKPEGKKSSSKKPSKKKAADATTKKSTSEKTVDQHAAQKDSAKTAKAEKPASDKKDAARKDEATKEAAGKEKGKTDKEKEPAEKESAAKESAAKKEPAPPSVKVEKGEFKVEVSLDAVFEAQKMEDVFVKPQEWQSLQVLTAVDAGTRVKRGDVLMTLDLEKIDRAIADMRAEMKTSAIALSQAEFDLEAMEKTTPLDLTATDRGERVAREDEKRFFDVGKPLSKKLIDYYVKQAEEGKENAEEELKQLEKMYKADDLTEETEAIVLKRAQRQVESADFMLDYVRASRDQTLQFELPRQEDRIKDSTVRAETAAERNRRVLPLSLARQKLEVERMRLMQQRAEDRLNRILADREAMIVKAPIDGIVYYGSCERGRWSGSITADDFRRGSMIPSGRVIMTVVAPRPLFLRSNVSERQLSLVHAGLKGTAEPAAAPDLRLETIVDSVSEIPVSPGVFDARLTVALGDSSEAATLMPGMAARVKLTAYKKDDALTLPPSAVVPDENDPKKGTVYVIDKDGKQTKTEVTLGKRNEKQVEILSGVAAGDAVLKEAPKDAAKDAAKEAAKDTSKKESNDATKKENADAAKDKSKDASKDAKPVAGKEADEKAAAAASKKTMTDTVGPSSKETKQDAGKEAAKDAAK